MSDIGGTLGTREVGDRVAARAGGKQSFCVVHLLFSEFIWRYRQAAGIKSAPSTPAC